MSIDKLGLVCEKRASFFSASSKHIRAEEYKVSKAGAVPGRSERKKKKTTKKKKKKLMPRERERESV